MPKTEQQRPRATERASEPVNGSRSCSLPRCACRRLSSHKQLGRWLIFIVFPHDRRQLHMTLTCTGKAGELGTRRGYHGRQARIGDGSGRYHILKTSWEGCNLLGRLLP